MAPAISDPPRVRRAYQPTSELAVIDFDGDGDLDIVAFTTHEELILPSAVYLNDGSASFTPTRNFGTGYAYNHMAVGDVDNDGDPDILVGSICIVTA